MVEKETCEGCDLCCRHVALEIDVPEDKEDFDQIKWFLVHRDVWVFIDHDDSWNLQFSTPCEKLDDGGDCLIYETRPQICREYSLDACEKYGAGDSFKFLWKSLEEFEGWLRNSKRYSKYATGV